MVTCRRVPGLKYIKSKEPGSGATRKKYGVIKETETGISERKYLKQRRRESERQRGRVENALGYVRVKTVHESVHIH